MWLLTRFKDRAATLAFSDEVRSVLYPVKMNALAKGVKSLAVEAPDADLG